MTDEGRRRSATMTSTWSDIVFEDLDDFNALDRCITRGMPASMFPFMYNSGVDIYEYACHEGNRAISNTLRNSRYLEAQADRGQ